ncbi:MULTISPECIES: EF-hand domain-containing protein [unclassified Streptomyces]|uniref:EF-hand domain-containing protein n=1 Tax=unclassified Streptomyces TaxID=2593676 RepID=UPI002E32D8F5|nr:EF-hand domain-containing protein [Streptomyces sp. NBC_01268]
MTATSQDVITAKLERAFDTVDANGDGQLEWADYKAIADRYSTAYRLDAADRRSRALQSVFQMFWLELLRHSGVDGDRLTKEQFVAASRRAAIDSSRINVTDAIAHSIFDVVDVNGDNEVGKDEFARALTDVWKIGAPDAMDAFHRMDTDGDGAISRQEFLRAMREYFFSDDPEAPGSLFFGRV